MQANRFSVLGFLLLLACPLAAKPRTEAVVFHPTTAAGESSRPVTSVAVSRPKTAVPVFKPTTSVQVFRPKTEVVVSHPTTTVEVVRPVTDPSVRHPGERGGQAGLISTSSPSKPAEGKHAAAENSVPASSSTTSMSGYQPPKAKDFKAAQLGGGNAGLGNKTDESSKDAAAASFQIPKGDAATLESILKSGNLNKADLTKSVQKKAGGK